MLVGHPDRQSGVWVWRVPDHQLSPTDSRQRRAQTVTLPGAQVGAKASQHARRYSPPVATGELELVFCCMSSQVQLAQRETEREYTVEPAFMYILFSIH